MSEFAAYLALAAYPAIIVFVFDWLSKASRWAVKNHSMIMRPDLKPIEEARGRLLLLGKYALLFLALRGLAGSRLWHIVPIVSHSRPWPVLIASGMVGGAAMLACRHGLLLLSPRAAEAEKNKYFLRGPVVLWLAIFFVGGFVEELWRALCIIAFQQNDYSAASVMLLTACCFGFAHLSGLPSRIAPGVVSVGADVMIGLMLGAIFVWPGNLIAPYLASVIYYASSFLFVRRRSSEISAHQQQVS